MSNPSMKISDLEMILQKGLEALDNSQLNPDSSKAAAFLVPDGYRPKPSFRHGNGRKIKSSAAAWNFDPSVDHIDISFEQIPDSPAAFFFTAPSTPAPQTPSSSIPIAQAAKPSACVADGVTILDKQQCCDALEEAQRSGLEFIGLKRFLAYILPAKGYAWTKSPDLCRKVLEAVIESGEVETYKVPNPMNPGFPTTAVKLRHVARSPAA